MKEVLLKNLHDELVEIISKVADFIEASFGQVGLDQIEEKALNSLVSYVDKHAEEQLVEKLSSLVPHATFLTEEGTTQQLFSDVQWIIDPLDGTTNFLYGIPHFSISVALQIEQEFALACVYDVMRKECFTAIKGGGAFLNNQAISVSSNQIMKKAVIATGFPYERVQQRVPFVQILEYYLENVRAIRRMGSAALDLAYVAAGRFDGYYECCLNPWDVAAGILLVEEAGGEVSDFKGGNDYRSGEEILVSNTHLHASLLEAFKKSE